MSQDSSPFVFGLLSLCLLAFGLSLVSFGTVLSLQTPSNKNQVLGTSNSKIERQSMVELGSGNSNNREWINLHQASVGLDPKFYPKLSKVTFEAALSIIGGEVYVRLINETTGAVLWSSTLVHNSPVPTWKSSPPLTLNKNHNNYTVQIKTSSGELGYIYGARLRLIHE